MNSSAQALMNNHYIHRNGVESMDTFYKTYTIGEKLGQGGQGQVFGIHKKQQPASNNKQLCVKLISFNPRSPGFRNNLDTTV